MLIFNSYFLLKKHYQGLVSGQKLMWPKIPVECGKFPCAFYVMFSCFFISGKDLTFSILNLVRKRILLSKNNYFLN